MTRFLKAVLFTLAISPSLQASNLSCSEQKGLAKASEMALFGFTLGKLPLGDRLAQDFTKTVVRGSCVFQVFYMYDYDPSVREPGWYLPFSVHVDEKNSTVYQERLTDLGAAKRDFILQGMNSFRDRLKECGCGLP